jgi:predicted permease
MSERELLGWRRLWIRVLLRLYPKAFRETWGRDLLDLYEDRARRDGRPPGLVGATLDVAVNALRLRARALTGARAGERRRGAAGARGWALQDLRLAARGLRRAPAFTGTAIVILSLGIGANTAVWSIVSAVLLDPLELDDPARLVSVWHRHLDGDYLRGTVTAGNLGDWRERLESFEGLAAYAYDTANLVGADSTAALEPRRVVVCELVGGLFDVLRPRPVLGRLPGAQDARPGAEPVVALAFGFWQGAFGADPAIVGRKVLVDGEPATVVGVAPRDLGPLRPGVELFRPLVLDAEEAESRTEYFLRVVGRLAGGVAIGQAQTELDLVMEQLRAEHPRANRDLGGFVEPLLATTTRTARVPLLVLLGAVVLVLLIACVNLAHLLLARLSARERELAVRRALGASSRRLFQLALSEAMVLAVLGGVGGVVLAVLVTGPLASLLPADMPRVAEVRLDGEVLLFALVCTLLSGFLFGGLPALRLPRTAALRVHGATPGRRASRGGGGLVVAEVALAVVLLACAALMVRTVEELRRVELGFRTEGSLALTVRIAGEAYDWDARSRFLTLLLDRLGALPGVEAAGAAVNHPASDRRNSAWLRRLARPLENGETPPWIGYNPVTVGFFDALEIRPVRGRLLSARGEGPIEVVINQTAQERFWPDRDPVGEAIGLGPEGELIDEAVIVGVVPDIREGGIDAEPWPMAYFSVLRRPNWPELTLLLSTSVGPRSLVEPATAAVQALDASIPVYGVSTSGELVAEQIAPRRALTVLLGSFSLLGLVLAVLGVGGLLAYRVARRRREIGIQMALGASSGRVLRAVLGEGLGQVAVGAALGIGLSLLAVRSISALLFGVSAADVPALAMALAVLFAGAAAAAAIPAWRASRIEPSKVLRADT